MKQLFYFLALSLFVFASCDEVKSAESNGSESTDSTTTSIEAREDMKSDVVEEAYQAAEIDRKLSTRYFSATGNEPSWHLQIYGDMHFNLSFLTEEFYSGNISAENITLVESDFRTYRFTHPEYELNIEIQETECSDGMSDNTYPYSVHVIVNTPSGREVYSGCGRYNGDYRLHNTWALEDLNGEKIDWQEVYPPLLNLNLSAGFAEGTGSCNDYHTFFEVNENEITFKAIATTLKACESMELEDKYYKAFHEGTYSFTLTDDGKLILENPGNRLVFWAVD